MDKPQLQLKIKRLEDSLLTDPDRVDAHLELGRLLELAGDSQSAELHYAAILRQDPRNGQALAAAGNLYLSLARYQDAIIALTGALAILPDSAEISNNLGVAFQSTFQYEKAEASFREALRKSPNYSAALNNLGALLLDDFRLEEAISLFNQALDVAPGNPDALNNLGKAYLSLGEKDNAIQCYEKAIAIRPELAIAHLNLSLIKNKTLKN